MYHTKLQYVIMFNVDNVLTHLKCQVMNVIFNSDKQISVGKFIFMTELGFNYKYNLMIYFFSFRLIYLDKLISIF